MQLDRLFEITYMLLERGTVTARALAERFEVSPRTIYRDVERLSAAGIPVYMEKGRNGGIRLLPDFVLDKALLTPGEKLELLAALGGLAAVGLNEAGGALRKLAALFGGHDGNWIEVDFTGWGWGAEAKEGFERLKAAILGRRVIAFTYFGGTGEKTSRVAEPLKLVFRGQAWYLYGWCRIRADYRFFKLSRMAGVVLTEEIFVPKTPPRTVKDTPAPPPETVTVAFRADADIAFGIFDAFPRAGIRTEQDGSLYVRAEMPHGEWLTSYFLSFGSSIEIFEPVSLRAKLLESLGTALSKYGK